MKILILLLLTPFAASAGEVCDYAKHAVQNGAVKTSDYTSMSNSVQFLPQYSISLGKSNVPVGITEQDLARRDYGRYTVIVGNRVYQATRLTENLHHVYLFNYDTRSLAFEWHYGDTADAVDGVCGLPARLFDKR